MEEGKVKECKLSIYTLYTRYTPNNTRINEYKTNIFMYKNGSAAAYCIG